jgi:hypothetical protein
MNRRIFLQSSTAASLGILFPIMGCQHGSIETSEKETAYQKLIFSLLKDWCDGMLKVQILNPENPKTHGALDCPACNKIHGRCMDAVYPFMYMADKTGESKYMDAAIELMEWSKNVSMPDGSWTVIPNPKSWRGISVFGAIALGEALHYHGHILPADIKEKWMDRLAKVGDYLYKNFDMTFTNINYGFTVVYALNLLGRILENETYLTRSRTLAKEIKNWFTTPNYLLFGEAKPSNKKSDKGLTGVDLGYNVEESLNGVVQYALIENDEELLQLLTQALDGHLHFMLPDGGWDNSWGTRQYKWSYWGSRTTDGCQIAFGLMADRNPVFGTAAYLSTELLQRCTSDGLLHGGLHYQTHGIKPCVHHTFAHAKPLTTLLHEHDRTALINKSTSLPMVNAEGIQHFPEIDVWLAAKGDFRATVSTYDFIYKEKAQQGSGGSMCLLYHLKVGPIFTASMAKYLLVEKNNQQPNPGKEEVVLTPRIEMFEDGEWFTNIYDLKAKVEIEEDEKFCKFQVAASLVNENRQSPKGTGTKYRFSYLLDAEKVEIKVQQKSSSKTGSTARLVLPIISPTGEQVKQVTPNRIEITKPKGVLIVEANVPLQIKGMEKERAFNMVPGVEAVPIFASFENDKGGEIICTLKVL